jgi:phage terminase large subunit
VVFQKPQTYEELPQGIKYTYYGVDWGFSNDPAAVIEVKVKDKELYLKQLVYEVGLTNEDLSYLMRDKGLGKAQDIVADSSEPKSIEELNRQGFKIKGVKDKSILFGIQKMRQYKIFIHKDSFNLIEEFDNYRYKKDRSGRITNQTQGADHGIDSVRYVVSEFIDNTPKKFVIL